LPSIFIVQLSDEKMKKPKKSSALPLYLSKRWKGRVLWCPFQLRIGASQLLANISLMPFLVHGSIFWCPRRRGTTPIHPEFGG
jgi:hypothetical protein